MTLELQKLGAIPDLAHRPTQGALFGMLAEGLADRHDPERLIRYHAGEQLALGLIHASMFKDDVPVMTYPEALATVLLEQWGKQGVQVPNGDPARSLTTVYVAMRGDRLTDTTPTVFTSEDAAVAWAKKQAGPPMFEAEQEEGEEEEKDKYYCGKEYCLWVEQEEGEEEEKDKYYCGKEYCLWVVEAEVDREK
jgi:hypothetical protein